MEKKEPSVQIILAKNLSIQDREIAMRYWKQDKGIFEKPSKIAADYNLRTVEITRTGKKAGFLKLSINCKNCQIERYYEIDSQAKAKQILAPLWICEVCRSKIEKERELEVPIEILEDFSAKESDDFSNTENGTVVNEKKLLENPTDLYLISELENALKTNLRLLELLKRAYLTNSDTSKNEMIFNLRKKSDIKYVDDACYSGEIIFEDNILIKANTKYSYDVYLQIGDDLRFHLFPKRFKV